MSEPTAEPAPKRLTPDQIYARIVEVRREDLGVDPTDLTATAGRAANEAELWDQLAEATEGRSTVPRWAHDALTVARRALHGHADMMAKAAENASQP